MQQRIPRCQGRPQKMDPRYKQPECGCRVGAEAGREVEGPGNEPVFNSSVFRFIPRGRLRCRLGLLTSSPERTWGDWKSASRAAGDRDPPSRSGMDVASAMLSGGLYGPGLPLSDPKPWSFMSATHTCLEAGRYINEPRKRNVFPSRPGVLQNFTSRAETKKSGEDTRGLGLGRPGCALV